MRDLPSSAGAAAARRLSLARWWLQCLGLLAVALLPHAATAAPSESPDWQAATRTATPVAGPRQRAGDPGAPLPVATPRPTLAAPSPTAEILPATLTATPVPPSPTPTATSVPTAVPTAAPTPTAAPAQEPAQLLLPEGSLPPGSAPRAGPTARPTPDYALRGGPGPPPSRTQVIGLPDEAGVGGWFAEDLLWLGVPSRTQFDGTAYSSANCGPSALGMILEAYGLWMPTHDLRLLANRLQGSWGYDDGIALDHLADIGLRAGLKPVGLYGDGGRGYHRWSVDEVRKAVLDGHPVIALTRYGLLPGNGYYGGGINHYIVITGLVGDDFLYNDSAFGGGGGRALIISAQQLERAWATADIPRHAVAFALGEERLGLVLPDAGRFGRGGPLQPALAMNGEALAAARAERARRVAPPDPAAARRAALDPVARNRDALLDGAVAGGGLLDSPFVGGPRAAVAPAVALPAGVPELTLEVPATLISDLAVPEPEPYRESGMLSGALLLLGGGVGGLYLLLSARGLLGRLRRVQ